MNLIQHNQPLARYSTFGIGGPARFFAEIRSKDELKDALRFAQEKEVPLLCIGKGSNVLFHDKGYQGLVLINKMDTVSIRGATAIADAGASFSLLGSKTARIGLSGLEFAAGIPGSVGGAIFMNAGANGAETKDVLESVEYISLDGQISVFHASQLNFSYRTSPFQFMKGIILSGTFNLVEKEDSRKTQQAIVQYRIATQPYKEKSAGCVFRNPEGTSAGKLIEMAGLKGTHIGSAFVSEMHANFIVNRGKATSEEVETLIRKIKETVAAQTGIHLEDEVRRIPYE